MSVSDQTRVFLAMMLCGACTAMAYDLFCVLRRGRLLTALADVTICVLLAAGMIGMGVLLACDPFRLYSFAGITLGWLVYKLSLGTIVCILAQTIRKLSNKVTK